MTEEKMYLKWGAGTDQVVLVTFDLPIREEIPIFPLLKLWPKVAPILEEENKRLAEEISKAVAASKARLNAKLTEIIKTF